MTLLEYERALISCAIRQNAARYRDSLLPCTMWPDGKIPVPGELQAMMNRFEIIEASARSSTDRADAERTEA